MGEIADLMLDGFLDEETGEVIDGDAPGHPRSPSRDHRKQYQRIEPKPVQCPVCKRRVTTEQGLADHRKAKGH